MAKDNTDNLENNDNKSNNKILSITLVTSNINKLREFRAILEPKIKVEHIKLEFPELRSEHSQEIAEMSAKMISEKLQKAVVVEDSGLFITALKDFPGTCSAYVHKRIGLEGILRLMDGINDARNNGSRNKEESSRQCFYKSAVAYCEPGKNPISFLGIEEGEIAETIRGKNGFGHDPIFIPKEENTDKKTYGEMPDSEQRKKFRRRAIEQLLVWMKARKMINKQKN